MVSITRNVKASGLVVPFPHSPIAALNLDGLLRHSDGESREPFVDFEPQFQDALEVPDHHAGLAFKSPATYRQLS